MSSGPYRRHSCPASLRVRSGGYRLERARQRVRLARVVQPPAAPLCGSDGRGLCDRGGFLAKLPHQRSGARGCKRHGPPCRKNMRPLPAEPSRDQVPGGAASRREPRRSAAWLWAPSFSCVSASPGLPWLALASPGLSPSLCLRPRPRGAADCSILYFTHEGVISRRTNLCCDAQSIAHIWRRRPVKRHTPCQQGSHNRPS